MVRFFTIGLAALLYGCGVVDVDPHFAAILIAGVLHPRDGDGDGRAADFFSLAFRNAASGMAITDQQGRFLQVNSYLCELLGYTKAELGELSLNDISHPEDRSTFSLYVERLTEGDTFHMERRFVHKNGRIEWGLHSVSRVPDGSGMYLSQIQEITAFKRVEEELRQSEERLRLAFSVLAEGIVVYEPDGTVQMNESARRFLGRDTFTEDLAGMLIDEAGNVLPLEDFPLLIVMRTGQPVTNRVYGLLDESGTRWVLVNARPLHVEPGEKPRGVVMSFSDITARRQLEEQLRHSQRMESVGRLAGGMAHDFNNLLMAILGEASVRLMDNHLPPELRKSFESMAASARRGASLTKNLLTFSRKQVFERKPIDLTAVLRSTQDMLERLLSGRVAFVVSGEPGAMVVADRGMLEQVLVNLVVNANDAMPQGGRLHVSVSAVEWDEAHIAGHPDRRPGRFICLTVGDTGAGMSTETQERIFEPYFTTKPAGKGTGLGLSIVYGIVRQHDGWIEFTSRPNEGTEFRVYFEAAETAPGHETAPPQSESTHGGQVLHEGRGQGVLVVEDDYGIRELIRSILTSYGYRVYTAHSAPLGLEILKARPAAIDLLITDVLLEPSMNGFELAQEARRLRSDLPIIFASGYQGAKAPPDLHLAEGENFLLKPFEIPALLEAIRQQLARAGAL